MEKENLNEELEGKFNSRIEDRIEELKKRKRRHLL